MNDTRASIDRKLDELSVLSASAKQDAMRRGSAAVMIATAGIIGLWWWRHAARAASVRRYRRTLDDYLRQSGAR